MPRRQMTSGRWPSMRAPAKLITPPVGRLLPAISENSVVLPAPLAPIKPTSSPSPIARLTLLRARKPPNLLLTLSTASSMRLARRARTRQPAAESGGSEQHEADEREPQQDHVDLRRVRPQQLRQQAEEKRTDDRSARFVA